MKRIAAILLLQTLSACNLYPSRPQQPALHDFGPVIALTAPAITGGPNPTPSCALPEGEGDAAAVDAPAWLHDERIRYRMLHADPTQVRFYALDAWLAPPPKLLAQRLRAAVDGSKYRLRLTLIDFEQVFDSPSSAHVILGFCASTAAQGGKPAAEYLFQYTQPCTSPDAKGAVDAYAAAVERATTEVRAWLRELNNILECL